VFWTSILLFYDPECRLWGFWKVGIKWKKQRQDKRGVDWPVRAWEYQFRGSAGYPKLRRRSTNNSF